MVRSMIRSSPLVFTATDVELCLRATARSGGWFTPDALIIVEEAAKPSFTAPEGFTELERRRYDDTEFTFLKFIPG